MICVISCSHHPNTVNGVSIPIFDGEFEKKHKQNIDHVYVCLTYMCFPDFSEASPLTLRNSEFFQDIRNILVVF